MKITLVLVSTLITTIAFSQIPEKDLKRTFQKLSESFASGKVNLIADDLTSSFTFNNIDSLLSKQFMATMLSQLPAKKLKKLEVARNDNDTAVINSKIVIDKYLGIFSQPMTFEVVRQDGRTLINHISIEGMDMTVQVSEGEEQNTTVDLSHLESIKGDDIVTFYPSGYKNIATKVNNRLSEGTSLIEKHLGESFLLSMGTVIIPDSMSNMTFTQPVLPITVKDQNELPTDSLGQFFINWAYYHEMTELHLTLSYGITDPNTRWFRDGIADYYSSVAAKHLDLSSYTMIMNKRKESYEKLGGPANLLNWVGTGSDKKRRGIDGGPGQYAAAMYFFIDITEEYGVDLIPKVLGQLRDKKNISTKDILKVMKKITGKDLSNQISSY